MRTRRRYNPNYERGIAVATVTVRIPKSLLERAQATTDHRDAASAIRRAVEIATGAYELNAPARRALEQSRREQREGKSSPLHHRERGYSASQASVKEIVFTRDEMWPDVREPARR
jgi:hypothetical protein